MAYFIIVVIYITQGVGVVGYIEDILIGYEPILVVVGAVGGLGG